MSTHDVIELKFYTKQPCPLCDRLKQLMRPVLDDGIQRVQVREIDISQDPGLLEQFRLRIPVVMHEDRILFEGRPEKNEVESALKSLLHK